MIVQCAVLQQDGESHGALVGEESPAFCGDGRGNLGIPVVIQKNSTHLAILFHFAGKQHHVFEIVKEDHWLQSLANAVLQDLENLGLEIFSSQGFGVKRNACENSCCNERYDDNWPRHAP